MKKISLCFLLLLPVFSNAQKTNYGLPLFNMEDVKSMKDSGSFDLIGLRTGLWVEYVFDSAGIKDYVQSMDMGYNSYPLFNKVLIKSKGKYIGGKREGNWKIYKSYSTSKPFKWDFEEEIDYKNGRVSGTWKYYTTTGKIIAQQTFKDGLPNGIYKKYYPNGKVLKIIPFKNGYINGTTKTYNYKGILVNSEECVNGRYSGKLRMYYSNGKLRAERIYKNGFLLNETKVLDRNGKPLEKGTIENGQGTVIFYDELGTKSSVSMYKNGLQNGKGIEYYSTGIIRREFNVVNDTLDGIEKNYDEKGRLQSEAVVKKGNYSGKRTFYYPNGKVSSVQIKKDNLLWNIISTLDTNGKDLAQGDFKDGTGTAKFYDDSCRLSQVDVLKNGLHHGPSKTYYTNGKLKVELNYQNDSIMGIGKSYYENGNIESECEIVNGYYNGIRKSYYKNGILESEDYLIENNLWNVVQKNDTTGKPLDFGNFKDGTGISKVYSDSCVLMQDLPFRNGRYSGESKTYYPSGKVKEVFTYANDTIEGTITTYYESGNLMQVATIHNGSYDGKSITYHENGKVWVEVDYVNGYTWNIKMNLDASGKPQDKGTLVDGNGTLIDYDENGKVEDVMYFIHGIYQPKQKP